MRRMKRRLQSRRIILVIWAVLFIVAIVGYTGYMTNRRLAVDPTTYQPLLQLIAQAESRDNYNAYFGNPANTSLKLTDMTLAEVLAWQADYVQSGSPSDAVGRYQIISTTLQDLTAQLDLDSTTKFDRHLQDRLAITLLERRGSTNYVNKEISSSEFAANLAKEWAALPKVVGSNPGSSYYDGDGLNKSLVSIDKVQKAIEPITAK